VWLDLPRTKVMRQVVARTIRLRLRRQVLWNGNVEPPLRTIFTNAEHIVRWAWTTHDKSAIVQLRTWHEAHHWMSGAVRDAAASSS